MKKVMGTIKWNLSYNKIVLLRSQKNLPSLRLRRSYAGTIEACREDDFQKTEGLPFWWKISKKEIKKYDDFDVIG